MRKKQFFFWYFLVALSVQGMDKPSDDDRCADYGEIEFDFDLDFFDSRVARAFRWTADTAWGVLGFDSSAYAEAKQALNDPNVLTELMMALAVVVKYPQQSEFEEALKTLIEEVQGGKLSDNFASFGARLRNSIDKKSSKEIFRNVKALRSKERLAIIRNLLDRRPEGNDIMSNKEAVDIIECLVEMLENFLRAQQ